jgi:L-ascorbate metabolism protein UlaG (beta-lactamase superfamily)
MFWPMILRLADGVTVHPKYADADVDCRLLFIGDRYRQLLRTYPEVIYRLSRPGGFAATARYLNESAEIRQYYNIEESGERIGVVMRDEIFREPASLEGLNFELSVLGGSRHRHYPIPLKYFAALGELLPLLGGDQSEEAVAKGLQHRLSGDALAWVHDLLTWLRAESFVEQAATITPNYFLRSTARPRATWVAHTSLLVQSQCTAVLFDPLLRGRLGLPRAAFDAARLELGAICCSHSHWDHCDVASLLLFDKRTPIIVPKVRHPTIFNPPFLPMLKLIGFADIREVDLWQPIQINDVEIVPVPFHGEQDEPDVEIDHYTYVVRTEGLSLYGGVDAYRDTFGDMRADLERVRRDYRPTVAFLPVSRMTYSYVHGGVNGFCRRVNTDLLDKEFQYTADPKTAVEWARLLDARWIVPYATFRFRKTSPSERAREFADEMAKAGLADRLMALRPLDSIEPDDIVGTRRTTFRQKFLAEWLRISAAIHRTDNRLRRYFVYRGIRRLLRPGSEPLPEHH